MTADLDIKADEYVGLSLAGGLAAVAVAAVFTNFFLEIVKAATEAGRHLPARESRAALIEALFVNPISIIGILTYALSSSAALP